MHEGLRLCRSKDITMQPQQQTSMTSAVPVQPVYISQPYQTASVVNLYSSRQSTIIGMLLIVAGCLSIIFNSVDLAIGIKDEYSYSHSGQTLSYESNGVVGHGYWCGVMVSILLFQITNVVLTAVANIYFPISIKIYLH